VSGADAFVPLCFSELIIVLRGGGWICLSVTGVYLTVGYRNLEVVSTKKWILDPKVSKVMVYVGDVIRNPVSFDRDRLSVTGIENSVPPSGTSGGVVFKDIL
jgi:hypothetical protein